MLRGKIPHFWLTCVAQKRRCLSSLLLCYPLDSDLSDGRCYPNFEQLEIGRLHTQHCTCTLRQLKIIKGPFYEQSKDRCSKMCSI